ncbi:MAG: RDD family protein [Dehalococcoidia bacterium]|nr:RDD family protein [Dehalococcoidia bacterium]
MESTSLDFASWPIRLVAYLIDDILPTIGGALMVIGFFLGLISLFEDGDFGSEVSTALIIAGVIFLVLGAGILIAYLVWWLIVLGRAQTPGKQIVGIRAVNYAGEPLGWGMMFVREFLVKGLLFGLLYGLTLGIMFFVDNLWPLWDENNQTLHDKVASTYVVYVPRG